MSAVDRPSGPEWDLGKIGAAVRNGTLTPSEARALAEKLRAEAQPAPRPDRSATRPQVGR